MVGNSDPITIPSISVRFDDDQLEMIAAKIARRFERGDVRIPLHISRQDGVPADEADNSLSLSGRELQVIALVANGKINKEIARALGISDQTVKNHLSAIFQKLGVGDRTGAVVACIRMGIIKV